jgi:nicotinamide-nucleotide amidase
MAAVAQMLGVPLVEDPDALAHIRARARRQYEEGRFDSPEPNAGARKMARVPRGARVLRNPVGGAPPLAIELPTRADPRWLFVLPGVPAELRATFEQELEPVFLAGTGLRRYRELHFEGVPESTFFPALTELEHTFPEVDFGSYPQSTGGVIIRARSSDPNALEEALGALRRLAPAPPSD